jgi:glycosyltransferase involved in cell wall biosynthesis
MGSIRDVPEYKVKKLRLLACAFACSPSGNNRLGNGEAVLGWNLVTQLARFHEVHVLTHPSNREGIEKRPAEPAYPTLHFHFFELPRWLSVLQKLQGCFQVYAYLWQIQAYFVARRLHREIPFDAFHHITYANDWGASYVGAFLPIPYLRGPCGGAQRTPRQYLSEYGLHNRFWERMRAGMGWILRHDPFFIRSQARAQRILVCNRESLQALPKRFQRKAIFFPVNGISSEDLKIIASRNGSKRPQHDDARPAGSVPTQEFRVFSAGRLIALKGYKLAIRAFGLFVRQHPEARLEIVGEGPDLERLRDIIGLFKLDNHVNLPGWMPRDKVLAAMCACDVFLFPSFRDGGGAVVIEAMAAGKPVICLDLAGPAMHVTEGCGIKIPAGSPRETTELIAQALERLCRDPELRGRMGKAARQRAEQMYTWDHLGERLQKIYEEALGAHSSED